MEIMWQIL